MSANEPAAAMADRSGEERSPSMRDLLAACAAADAVSTPPKTPPADPAEPEERPAPRPHAA
ncbi:hypothetical protein FHS39_003649 [Streptomyces olivoverticillatus]|uniref:Uncharacterized protein n=1 Tax=Streptomyces olivoverticillatus TaxID=66427 RepID=A0A7W7PKT5_9ACTN|nr:hypothetical protein [Streptomyces olivoverticillatus]MBB4894591.1 hypothetical protein [Streptomyces olivoverticillatus]